MAKQTIAAVVARLIAETKKLELQLNTTTTLAKGAQPLLTGKPLQIISGEVFTSTEKTKLGTAVTEAALTAKGYATTAAMNAAVGAKQDTIAGKPLQVLNGEVFTTAYKGKLDGIIAGGTYLGEFSVPDNWSIANIKTQLNTDYPSAQAGDHIEIIQPGPNAGDINYITYTKGAGDTWSAGTPKNVHIKGGNVDLTAYLTQALAATTYAPIGDVSMDDAEMTALEAIVITS